MPTSAFPRIFVSAASRELGSFRQAVAEVLLKKDALPVIQEHFPPDHRSVVAMLEDRISQCSAVICLVGRSYGHAPLKRDEEEPRRSYTQLEYEIAVELGKPVFVFVATDDCTFDSSPDEAEELRELQREHLKRIVSSDRIRMTFHSREHLAEQVRIMDLNSLAHGPITRLVVLLFAELLDLAAERKRRGEEALVREVVQPFRKRLDEIRARWEGTLRAETPGEFEVNFQTADAAVNAALALHAALVQNNWHGAAPDLRIGIHVGQIVEFVVDEVRVLQAGHAMDVCRQLARKAVAGQTLLSRTAFDVARELVRQAPSSSEHGGVSGDGSTALVATLDWRSHGRYLLTDADEVLDVYEVGVAGVAPFVAPPGSIEQQPKIPPWRPAVGREVPHRAGWFLERKLGEGGFGEVWVARDDQTKDLRVFKFCFDSSRLSSFERELTLFRLLRDELGKREDIARLIQVNLKEGPYFLESEYVDGGNLRAWGETDGRLAALPLEERLRLTAEIATAVAGAHSVGVIHKDLKPSNIFMRRDADGRWHPILADFGIGAIDDPRRLKARNITVAGLTLSLPASSTRSGTPMYQPPEANLGRAATVQWDVYALGVLLYQMVVADFDQPLAHGWERTLASALERGRQSGASRAPKADALSDLLSQSALSVAEPAGKPLAALDPSGETLLRLLKEDISACVEGDSSARLASVAQLKERLQTLDRRVADARARVRSERARARTRRLRAALAVSIAALVSVGGLLALAFTEWRLALRNEKLATKNETIAKTNEKRASDARAAEQKALAAQKEATVASERDRTRAEKGEREATENAKIATAYAERATIGEREANQNLYMAQVQLAHQLIKDGDVRTAWEMLDPSLTASAASSPNSAAAQAKGPATDRGWEWYYLTESCRSRLAVVRNPGSSIWRIVFHPDGRSYFTGDADGNVVQSSALTGETMRTFWNSGRKETGLGFGLRWHNGQLTVVSQTVLKVKRTTEDVPEPGDVVVALGEPSGRMVRTAGLDGARIAAIVNGPIGTQLELDVMPSGKSQLKHFKVTRREYDCLGQSSAIADLTISPDGTLLGTAGWYDKSFRVWGLDGYLFPTALRGGSNLPDPVRSMAISADNAQIALAIGTMVTIGSLQTSALRVEVCGETADRHKGTVTQVAFVPLRPWLASVANDGTLKLWDVSTKKHLRTVDVNSSQANAAKRGVSSLALSPDGKRIAAVTLQGKLLCWSADDRAELKPLDEFALDSRSFVRVAVRPSDGLLATAGYDGIIRLFDQKGTESRRLAHSRTIADLALSPEGRYVVSATVRDPSVSLWRLDVPEQLVRAVKQYATHLKLTPEGRRLISTVGDTISVRDSASGRLLRRHTNLVDSFALISGGTAIVSARGTHVVRIDLLTGKEDVCFELPSGRAVALASDPSGELVALTNEDGEKSRVLVLDRSQKHILAQLDLEKSEEDVNQLLWLAFSRDGRTLAFRRSQREVRIWRWQEGASQAILKTDDPPYCGAFHPTADELAIGGFDGLVSFWAIGTTGKPQPRLTRQLKGHRSCATDIDFTPDGHRMATSGADGTVRIWDPASGHELLNLRYANDSTMAVAFDDRGWRLYAGGEAEIKMWESAILCPQAARDDPWFYLSRGCARSNVGLWEQAVDDFSTAIDRGVDDPYVWQYRGAAQARLNNHAAALADLDRAAKLVPADPSVWVDRHLSQMASAATPLAREWAEENYSRAVALVGLAIQPFDDKLYKRWWNYSAMEGEDAEFFGWQRLFADLTRTINRGGAPWYVYRARGLAQLDLAAYSEAVADFQKATELKPDDWQSWRGLARSHMGRFTKTGESIDNLYAPAVAAFDRAIALYPDGWDLYYCRGLCHRKLAKFERAIEDFTLASARRPKASAPVIERGYDSLILRQFAKAAEDFARARQLGASDDDVAVNTAYAYLGAGDRAAYKKLCEAWVGSSNFETITPSSANTLAWACSIGPNALLDPMRAVRLAERAVAANPDAYYCQSTLATALHRAGQHEQAIVRMNEAVKLRAEGATAYDLFVFALAHHALGHASEARQSFDQAIAWIAKRKAAVASGAEVDYYTDMDQVQYDIMKREVEQTLGVAASPVGLGR